MINFTRYTICLFILLFAAGCAIRVAPTGGEKDTAPPKVLAAAPDTFATNFNSKTIEFEFDEYIQVNDLGGKLVVSPPLESTPEYKIKGKRLVLTLQEPLRPNTTYNFNFGAAIADVNEGTTMSNFNYVVSTGSFIDSLSIAGNVINAFTLGAEKDATVMLYTETGDSLPYKSKPAYFAKTDDSGGFKLSYIAPGKYKIFVLKETNNNYLYDSEDEQIAFIDTLIQSDKKPLLSFRLFQAPKKKQKLVKNTYSAPGKLVLQFNKPVQNFKLKDLKDSANVNFYVTEYNTKRDSLIVWFTKKSSDTLRLAVFDNGIAYDTLKIDARKKTKGAARSGAAPVDTMLRITFPTLISGKGDRSGRFKIAFSHPVTTVDWDKVKLYSGLQTITYKHEYSDSANRVVSVIYPFSDDTEYKLVADKGAFTDVFGFKNDSLKTTFTITPERDYGTMALNLTLPDSLGRTYILQLLNSKNEVLKEQVITRSQKIDYGTLPAGTYGFRLVLDENKNARWDTGNYNEHIQPEVVLYSSEKPNIRAAWDLTVEWNLTAKSRGK